MLRAARCALLLSVFFVVVYGSTNWFTAQRPASHVSTWFFAWELTAIPYVPLLIVPYMSMDIVFFFAPFLCTDQREIRLFSRRVVWSILVASVFFLLLPLKLAWPERPHVGGWFGAFVEQSCRAPFLMEYPHNLFPALHIVLCLIVADVYARHLPGIARGFSNTWFSLIGLSTVLTWQHHLVDVAGGLVLAGFAFYLFRETDSRLPAMRNARVGCYYAVLAVAVLALAPALAPWGTFLLWPAAALGIVAAAYFQLGPGIFRKSAGRLPFSTRVALAPVLMGHRVSLAYYRRRSRAWDVLAPGVWIGRTLTAAESAAAIRQGVTAVLDLTAEFSETAPFRTTRYHNVPILDLTAPTQDQLHEAVAFIADQAAEGVVYVHCKIGYSRSAAVAGAYLLAGRAAATVDGAIARLREVRPAIVIRPEVVGALHAFARAQGGFDALSRTDGAANTLPADPGRAGAVSTTDGLMPGVES
jgi:protein-tyrosine phosphatase